MGVWEVWAINKCPYSSLPSTALTFVRKIKCPY